MGVGLVCGCVGGCACMCACICVHMCSVCACAMSPLNFDLKHLSTSHTYDIPSVLLMCDPSYTVMCMVLELPTGSIMLEGGRGTVKINITVHVQLVVIMTFIIISL